MNPSTRTRAVIVAASACTAAALALPARAADAEADALSLQSAPEKPVESSPGARVSIEGAIGRGWNRYESGSDTLRRLSIDLYWSTRLDARWRLQVSNRLDVVRPQTDASATNSLRELYVGWQDASGGWAFDAGRINLRQGPALAYNPTDFFRDGSIRVATTVNPLLVREYRLGSVMLRGQRLWSDGSVSLAVSPKLESEPSRAGASADLGSTNNRNRAMASLGTQWSDKVSTQLHLYQENGSRRQLGASVSALASDSTVVFAEAAAGREPSLLDRAGGSSTLTRAGRVAAGLTYTTPTRLSLTAELEHNGFAARRSELQALAVTRPATFAAYLIGAERDQDIAARRAVALHAKQTDAGMRNLDLSAFIRWNTEDHSALTWIELRRRYTGFDVAAQWLRYTGERGTVFGSTPYRTSFQLLATAYF